MDERLLTLPDLQKYMHRVDELPSELRKRIIALERRIEMLEQFLGNSSGERNGKG